MQTGGSPALGPSGAGGQATSAATQAASVSGVPTGAATSPSAAQAPLATAVLQSGSATQSPVAVLAAEVPVSAAAAALNMSGGAGNAPAGGPAAAVQRPLGIYATSMELPGKLLHLHVKESPLHTCSSACKWLSGIREITQED